MGLAFKQTQYGTGFNSGFTFTFTPLAVGSLLIINVAAQSAGGTPGGLTVSDSANGTWALVNGQSANPYWVGWSNWVKNTTTSQITITVTASWLNGGYHAYCEVTEITGQAASPIGNMVLGSASATSPSNIDSTSNLVANSGDIVLVLGNSSQTTTTFGVSGTGDPTGLASQGSNSYGITYGVVLSGAYNATVGVNVSSTSGDATGTVIGVQIVAAPPVININPPKGSVTITGHAPALQTTLSPAKASITITGHAPTLANGRSITPPKASLTITGHAPTLTITLSPPKASIAITGHAPTLKTTLSPAKGLVAITGYAPQVLNEPPVTQWPRSNW